MGPFSTFLLLLLKRLTGNALSRLVIKDLFQKFSYRYSKTGSNSLLNLLRYLLKAIRLIFSQPNNLILKSTSIVFDGAASSEVQRLDYLNSIGITDTLFVSREKMNVAFSLKEKIGICFMLFISTFLIFPLYLVRSDKAKIALIILELTELAVLSKIISESGCKKCYVFSAYEKDISFLGYYFKYIKKIEVSLFPSPNPISIFYKTVICNRFFFTAPFQMIEYEALKNNWDCDATEIIPPPGFNDIVRYNENHKATHEIGFVSSGGHLRKALSHTNNFNNADNLAEEATIKVVSELSKKANIRVIVYLHPLEKKSADAIKISEEYYQNCFGTNVAFAPYDQPSKWHFYLCKIAVSGFSSAQIERLFGGYKTLFAPMGYLKNYFGDARLESISANNNSELEKLIIDNLDISEEFFFSKYNLKSYHFSNYKF